ncbi:DUF1467 family protein [Novosphingobium sp. 1949]|uniref:DUF1467 family protein n=1 Tax=Novosphingobium organovorum TaxID=2930092 RepID=A0ABT0B7T6_9SPHN|nr:DUF1467 family protein [Novosphingobium organovorum]MCJ2181131.1 DUF1467 family protein [Novosphingobium organovorum]
MKWTSMVAIYGLLWVLSAFIVMPIGLRTPDEVDDYTVEKGHADSAPVNFRPGRIALRATILAAGLCGLFYLNWTQGWITRQTFTFFGGAPVDLGY